MRKLNGFIEVTTLVDGEKALIRAECVSAVFDNPESEVDYGVKPSHRCIFHSGTCTDVIETMEEICDMIYAAEL